MWMSSSPSTRAASTEEVYAALHSFSSELDGEMLPANVALLKDAVPLSCKAPLEHQSHRKVWTEEEKRAYWKQKKIEKKERKRTASADRRILEQAQWEHLSEDAKEMRRAEAAQVHERRRQAAEQLTARCEAQLADPHVPTLVFDLSFAWCMSEADTKSTISQVKFSYSALRTAGFPLRPMISSLLGKERHDREHDAVTQSALLQTLEDFEGFHRYPPRITREEHWSEVCSASQVVYLTADSPDVLSSIEPDTVYVVGAFVDHNAHKGLSYAAAQRHGVRTARLPIKESVVLGNRCKVLTINHVVDVLIHFDRLRARGITDWAQAIDNALPTRRTQQVMKKQVKRQRSGSADEREEKDDGEGVDALRHGSP